MVTMDKNHEYTIDQQFEDLLDTIDKLNKAGLLQQNEKEMFALLSDPNKPVYPEVKIKIIEKFRAGLIDLLEKQTIDPKFTKLLQEHHVDMWLRDVFQKMNITTLGDLVKYKDIEDLTADYQKIFGVSSYERANGSQLSARIEKKLTSFMKSKNISFGMSTKLSDKLAADQEKMKKLLLVSFDLSQLENRKAMKEFGIENTSGIFTKLYSHGVKNLQDLLNTYTSLDEIVIEWFGKRAKAILDDCMQKNNLSFGMDLPAIVF